MKKVNLDNISDDIDYANFAEEHKRELLESAVAAIDPVKMGMTRDQALTLGGAMKSCGFSRQEFADIMAKSPEDKGTFSSKKQWDKFTGKGQHGTAGEGTIFDYAKQCGWTWPAPSVDDLHNSSKKPHQKEKEAAAVSYLAKWQDDFKVVCIMDEVGYKEKPAKVWEIRNREKSPTPAPVPMSVVEFAQAVTKGQTFSPTVYNKELTDHNENGTPDYYYRPICQQIFIVDIDNEEFAKDENGEYLKDENGKRIKQRIEKPLTREDALHICDKHGIKPFFVYETFSSKKHRDDPEAPYSKFRLCFATNEPVTVQEYGERGIQEFINYFISLFGKAADKGTTDPARLIYGTDEKERGHLTHNIIDKEKLYTAIHAVADPVEETEELAPDPEAEKEQYMQTSAAEALQDFLDGIKDKANTPAISTGFPLLDEALDGGLYEGLYIIGAVSSLGKTTLALQIIDQIAQQDQDCLVFSLEMARSELIAKSISRLTFLMKSKKSDAKTTRGITDGTRYANYSQQEQDLISLAMESYKGYAQHIFIHEGVGDIGVKKVRKVVQQHIDITGRKPVVLIDYLQILAPYDMRASDKQNTDKATLELKRISRDYKIPVIGISSFNRDNYLQPVNNASFKESGAIEYGSDVLIGLQYDGMDYKEGEADGTRQKRIRSLIRSNEAKAKQGEAQKLQAKILKQRNGSKGEVVFSFYAMFNCFRESMDEKDLTSGSADIFEGIRESAK